MRLLRPMNAVQVSTLQLAGGMRVPEHTQCMPMVFVHQIHALQSVQQQERHAHMVPPITSMLW